MTAGLQYDGWSIMVLLFDDAGERVDEAGPFDDLADAEFAAERAITISEDV